MRAIESMTRRELTEALQQQENAVDLMLRAGVQYGAFLNHVGIEKTRRLKRLVGSLYMADALVLAAIKLAYTEPRYFGDWIESQCLLRREREKEEADE